MSVMERHRTAIEAINRHDAAAAAALYADEAVVHDPFYSAPLEGRDAIRQDFEAFFRAFPDLRLEAPDVVMEEGETLAYETRFSGTNTGPLASPDGEVAATNRRIEVPIAVFVRLNEAGEVREARRYYDVAGLVQQLGLA